MKRALAIPLCLLGLCLSGLNAAAGGPERVPAPVPEPLFFECPTFTAVATFPANQEYALIFTFADGTQKVIITGRLVVRFTNPVNGKSLTANISGPGSNTLSPDGTFVIVMNGTQSDGVTVSAGHTVVKIDPNGGVTATFVGHLLVDVCTALS